MSDKVDCEESAVVRRGRHGDVPFSARNRGSIVVLDLHNLSHELALATLGHLLLGHRAAERILESCLGVLFDR